LVVQRQTRTVGILVRIEEDIRSVIFVVTEAIALISVSVAEQGGASGGLTLLRNGRAAISGYSCARMWRGRKPIVS
jgi:hypothetical protein